MVYLFYFSLYSFVLLSFIPCVIISDVCSFLFFNINGMYELCFQEVVRLETQYWTLVDIPKQEKQETVPAFVLRACAIMEKTQKSGEGVKTSAKLAEEAQDRRERIERLESKYT